MIRFLVNPAAGGGKARGALEALSRAARRHGATLHTTHDAEDLVESSRRAAAEGVERLLVAGGDGTFHHAVQGLAGSECALGPIPLGRGNDLAGTLGVVAELEKAIEGAVTAPVRRMDLGRVESWFFNGYCGLGFDSEAARRAYEGSRLFRGPLAYPAAVVGTLASFRAPVATVEHDEGVFQGRVMFVTVCNCPRFGGGMRIAPEARVDDGLLDLVIVEQVSKLELLRVFPRVYKGTHLGHRAFRIVRTRSATIRVDSSQWLFSDGEPVRQVRDESIRAEIWPGALRVAAPGQT